MKRIQIVLVLAGSVVITLLICLAKAPEGKPSASIVASNQASISAERVAMFREQSKKIAGTSFSSRPGASLGCLPMMTQVSTFSESRSGGGGEQSAIRRASQLTGSSRLSSRNSVPGQPPIPAVPTPEQSRQISLTPLAFLTPPVEAGLTAEQTTALATIGDDFVRNVGETGQDPADPAYLQKWENALSLADEQVWAVAGQGAYEALVNQRAQAAGNLPAGQ